jgi:hypothetical protein
MANKNWTTGRRRDADVIAALERIASAVGSGETWSLNIHVLQGQPVLINGAWGTVKDSQQLTDLLSVNEPLAWQFNATYPSVPGANLQIVRQPETLDTVTLNIADGLSAQQYIPFLTSTATEFPSFYNTIAIEKVLGKEIAEFYRARESAVLRLEGVTQKLIGDTDKYRLVDCNT